ncbi:class I SAM-dependent methyltransferase [Sporosarcina cyprini]|uniref:class I SAM-dependent methyltransferase n=1 Tax=Sporosarcina cyprini TaxID=2910523 RepID=UPI001EDED4F9|nr:class I SAM-dependent methyltransferase [Sporosarcina cyprini]MCG3086403.1 class I SAM-dependent methyltransferase [Sporosarcina cyprini]
MEFNHEMATEYDRGIRRTFPAYEAMFKMTRAYLYHAVGPDAEILLAGAGGGNELEFFGPPHPNWRFTAVDPSRDMLELAARKATALGLSERIRFVEGTVDNVKDFKLFDAATCLLVLHFIQDEQEKEELLRSIRKRLKPGAPFILAAMYRQGPVDEFDRLVNLWKVYWLETTGLSKEEVDKMEESVRSLSFLTEEAMRDLLHKTGFSTPTKFLQNTFFGCWICHAGQA